ncbi:MAG: hypothetical protein IPM23_07090 [Candidatus Melainabacteria bacterium]|nr:hypothetical protein [Candidatus Melainabacteria bacterium]
MTLNTSVLKDTWRRANDENGGTRSLGLAFYKRLFEKYPGVKPLFSTPPEDQHKKLVASIGSIVAAVENQDRLVPYLQAMAIRHLRYKTENEHYAAVAENLVAVLGEHLSAEGDWTDEMKETWQSALKIVCDVMIEAASNPEKYAGSIEGAGYQKDGFRKGDPRPWELDEAVKP